MLDEIVASHCLRIGMGGLLLLFLVRILPLREKMPIFVPIYK